MQTLAEGFFTQDEQLAITMAVQRAEQQTAGEIVPMVVTASHAYPEAELTGAAVLALPVALAAALATSSFFWWQGEVLWFFLGYLSVFFLFGRLIVRSSPALLRLFIRRQRAASEVERAAFSHFYASGLQATRDANGVLIYISVLERRVWILGDRGINDKLPQQTWQAFVGRLTAGIKEQQQGAALCAIIEEIGSLLHAHFPPKDDDRNELSDLIIETSNTNCLHTLIVK